MHWGNCGNKFHLANLNIQGTQIFIALYYQSKQMFPLKVKQHWHVYQLSVVAEIDQEPEMFPNFASSSSSAASFLNPIVWLTQLVVLNSDHGC